MNYFCCSNFTGTRSLFVNADAFQLSSASLCLVYGGNSQRYIICVYRQNVNMVYTVDNIVMVKICVINSMEFFCLELCG